MKAVLLFAAITGGLLSFNSFAASCPVGATVSAGTYKPYYEVQKPDGTSNIYINVGGCEYLADAPTWTPDGWVASSSPFVSTGNPAKEGVSSSSDENGNQPEPDIPEQPSEPEKPPEKPDLPSAEQLLSQWLACSKGCDGIKSQLNALSSGEMLLPDATKTNFYTTDSGMIIKCSPSVDGSTYLIGTYPGYGYMNQAQILHATHACNSVYNSVVVNNDNNKPDTGDGNNPDTGDGNKPDTGNGNKPGNDADNPGIGDGSGGGSTDNNDNGDVVAAIDRFHADNNASHKQLLDEIKKKDDYSDTANKVGDLFTNGISDFKSGAESSINSLIDSLENYAPGLKGFGLPDGFYSNSGHCVPLDMSFAFTVPMTNYSVPVKLSTDSVCKFYDGYPRELLRMLIYMLTVFVLIALLKQSLK